MKTLTIEWRHYAKEGATCERCSGTGANLKAVLAEYARRGISIELRETLLTADRIAESNLLLINGVPLEALLADAAVGESDCPSCGCLTGESTRCRTVQWGDEAYEELSQELIRRGVDVILARNMG